MHPRLLKTFLAVARSRNVTHAAKEVHLAQSSVSDQIQSLEAELGASLFSRSTPGLKLTPAGETLKSYAQDILALADEARAVVQATAGQMGGSVTIGALETIASRKLPLWLPAFGSLHPDIELKVKVAGSGDLLRGLESGEIDVAFCFEKGVLDERLARQTISVEPLVLIAPGGEHPPPGSGDLAALAAASFVATAPGCVYRGVFDDAFAAACLEAPKIAVEAESIGTIARLVAAGTGFGLVPRLAVAEALDRGEIVETPWPGPVRTAAIAMIWRRRRVQPRALKLLLAVARAAFAPVKSADALPRHAVSSLS